MIKRIAFVSGLLVLAAGSVSASGVGYAFENTTTHPILTRLERFFSRDALNRTKETVALQNYYLNQALMEKRAANSDQAITDLNLALGEQARLQIEESKIPASVKSLNQSMALDDAETLQVMDGLAESAIPALADQLTALKSAIGKDLTGRLISGQVDDQQQLIRLVADRYARHADNDAQQATQRYTLLGLVADTVSANPVARQLVKESRTALIKENLALPSDKLITLTQTLDQREGAGSVAILTEMVNSPGLSSASRPAVEGLLKNRLEKIVAMIADNPSTAQDLLQEVAGPNLENANALERLQAVAVNNPLAVTEVNLAQAILLGKKIALHDDTIRIPAIGLPVPASRPGQPSQQVAEAAINSPTPTPIPTPTPVSVIGQEEILTYGSGAFDRPVLNVSAGTALTLEFDNKDVIAQTLLLSNGEDSGLVSPGGKFVFPPFTTSATVTYSIGSIVGYISVH